MPALASESVRVEGRPSSVMERRLCAHLTDSAAADSRSYDLLDLVALQEQVGDQDTHSDHGDDRLDDEQGHEDSTATSSDHRHLVEVDDLTFAPATAAGGRHRALLGGTLELERVGQRLAPPLLWAVRGRPDAVGSVDVLLGHGADCSPLISRSGHVLVAISPV